MVLKKKVLQAITYRTLRPNGGRKRVRTAIAAFAELCLTTRPFDQSILSECKDTNIFCFCKKNKKYLIF